MNESYNAKWTFWAISDADEPGDAAYTGMRHRDFDGVTLVLWPDADGVADRGFGPAREADADGKPFSERRR